MEIEKNAVYIVDGDLTYLCIGFTNQDTQAVLAPYWSDDEDCLPDIQNDSYLICSNPYNPFDGFQLEKIGAAHGELALV